MRQSIKIILWAICFAFAILIATISGWRRVGDELPIPNMDEIWCCGEERDSCAIMATLQNGILRVIGKGAMRDYAFDTRAPWHESPIGREGYSLSITNIIIEEGVTHIGREAFAKLPILKSITIPASVLSIGEDAFDGNDYLVSITVAAKNTRYYSENNILFNKKGDTLMLCPRNNPLGAYTVPNNVIVIEERAFNECTHLKHVTIPGNVKVIGKYAFRDCDALSSITIEDGVTVIGEMAFRACTNLLSVTIPGSVTSAGREIFIHCVNLKTVTIKEGVTTVGEGTFMGCDSLVLVTIPSSVASIGDHAFFECNNLASVVILNPTPPSILEKTFCGLPSNACLYVFGNSVDFYYSADLWKKFECIKPVTDLLARVGPLLMVPAVSIAASSPVFTQTLSLGWSQFWHRPSAHSGEMYHNSKEFRTVKINGQTWMAENLKWPSWFGDCYDNDTSNCKKYGNLYDWNSAMTACPKGWHLPSNKEWEELVKAAGGKRAAGKKLKSKTGWTKYKWKSGHGTDTFGFSARPGGYRAIDTFYNAGYAGFWWSATEYNKGEDYRPGTAYGWYMHSNVGGVGDLYINKGYALSVRCAKDRRNE